MIESQKKKKFNCNVVEIQDDLDYVLIKNGQPYKVMKYFDMSDDELSLINMV